MKILYVFNDIEYFFAHRVNLVRAMRDLGHEVIVAAGNFDNYPDLKVFEGIELIRLDLNRHAFDFFGDIGLVFEIAGLIKEHRPDAVHAFTIKPILYSGLAARIFVGRHISKSTRFVATFAGLGKVFEPGNRLWVKFRRLLVARAIRHTAGYLNTIATFENRADLETLTGLGLFDPAQCIVTMGAGIRLEDYTATKRTGPLTIAFASRLIAEKGVDTFLAAACAFSAKGADAQFLLAGMHDPDNPDAVSLNAIEKAADDGIISWHGSVDGGDMPGFLKGVDVLCLPTRLKEGLPRILLEAAASGCALIASDQPACRGIVQPGKNGWLLNPPDENALVIAIGEAMEDVEKTRTFGKNGRELVLTLPVSDRHIRDQFLAAYNGHISARG